MTATRTGSPDGVTVNLYRAGETYDVPDALGRAFVGMGAAEAWRALPVEPASNRAGMPPEGTQGQETESYPSLPTPKGERGKSRKARR